MIHRPARVQHGLLIAALLVASAGVVAVAARDQGTILVLSGEDAAGVAASDLPPADLPAADPAQASAPPVPTVGGDVSPSAGAGVLAEGPATPARTGAPVAPTAPADHPPADPDRPAPPRLVLATPTDPMPAGPLTVDGVDDLGTAARVAQGFLHGIYPPRGAEGTGPLPLDAMRQLRPVSWRLSLPSHASDDAFDWRPFDWARDAGAELTYLVSDSWHTENQIVDPIQRGLCTRVSNLPIGNSIPPWQDWTRYRSWLTAYVDRVVRNGQEPTFWEPFNEPIHASYNFCDDFTFQRQLEVWKVTYEVIRGRVPDARIIGPSTALWLPAPDPHHREVVDLATFLDFVVDHGLELAAVNWHEIADTPTGSRPSEVAAHVRQARQMLDARGLTDTLVMVNEYLSQPRNGIPGWIAGYLAAFESAGVDRATRTCWGREGDDDWCRHQTVGGLFDQSGGTKMSYWVHEFYGRMAGTRVRSESTDDDLATLAVRDDEAGVLRLLVGRHHGCAGAVATGCPLEPVPAAEDVTLLVRAPWVDQRYRIVATRLAVRPGATAAADLPTVIDTVAVPDARGILELVLPAVADGDALTLTVTPT